MPLHAIVGTDALDGFGKRMIDLQMVPGGDDARRRWRRAGEALGERLATGAA